MATIKIECTRSFGENDVRKLPTQEIDLDALSKAQIAWLVERGIEESARNSFAGETLKKHEGGIERTWQASVSKWNSWFVRLRSGEVLSSGGGGARLSLYDQCLRDTIRDFFSLAKVKARMKEPLSAAALAKLAADVDVAASFAASLSEKLSESEFKDKFATMAKELEAKRLQVEADDDF